MLSNKTSNNFANRLPNGKGICSELSKSEFMAKFYDKPVIASPKKAMTESLHSITSLNGNKKGLMDKTMLRRKSFVENFKDKQKCLLSKSSVADNPDQAKINKEATLFEKFKKDYTDPFESAKEGSATLGQIIIVNTCMSVLGLFSLL